MRKDVLDRQAGPTESNNPDMVPVNQSFAIKVIDHPFVGGRLVRYFARRAYSTEIFFELCHHKASPCQWLRRKCCCVWTIDRKVLQIQGVRLYNQRVFLTCFIICRNIDCAFRHLAICCLEGDAFDSAEVELAELGVRVQQY